MDFALMLNILVGVVYVFAPALLITILVDFSFDTFLGLISAFMFIGASFGILPISFTALSIVLAGIYIYITFLRGST